MIEHRYILEPYKGMSTRYQCPSCQQSNKTFSLYIDTETGEQIHHTVGRCNRESNCGYHYTPKQYFQDNNLEFPHKYARAREISQTKPPQLEPTFIPNIIFKSSLKEYKANNLAKYLIELFGETIASQLINTYFIGTSKHWNGASVFWQIDSLGKIRTGKIMLYSPITGKRVKEPYNHITWVHTAVKQPNFELKQCLFGEHLLNDRKKTVAIVESEKTAVIASVYLPQFIWVAVGSLTNLNAVKCSILKGRTVVLFPDLNGFEKWSKKANELSHLAKFIVSDLLELKATDEDRSQGLDLADYLIKYDYKTFALNETEPAELPPAPNQTGEAKPFAQPEPAYYFGNPEPPKPANWEYDIAELENFFAGIEIPIQPLILNGIGTITNYSLFIESHLATIKTNNGKQAFSPYLHRLQELKDFLR